MKRKYLSQVSNYQLFKKSPYTIELSIDFIVESEKTATDLNLFQHCKNVLVSKVPLKLHNFSNVTHNSLKTYVPDPIKINMQRGKHGKEQ
jgi:hypothetical protein